jgi:hypothetical protein
VLFMADSADSTTLLLTGPADPVRRLSHEQHFRLRVARNDLERAHELDLAGASPVQVALMTGALRSSLMNALAIIDNLTGERL